MVWNRIFESEDLAKGKRLVGAGGSQARHGCASLGNATGRNKTSSSHRLALEQLVETGLGVLVSPPGLGPSVMRLPQTLACPHGVCWCEYMEMIMIHICLFYNPA